MKWDYRKIERSPPLDVKSDFIFYELYFRKILIGDFSYTLKDCCFFLHIIALSYSVMDVRRCDYSIS